MTKPFEYLQESQVEKHREHLHALLSGINGVAPSGQTGVYGIARYEIMCEDHESMTDGLLAVGIPAEHDGDGSVFIFSDDYPFYAQNRICINKVAKEIIRLAIEQQQADI